VYAHLKRQGYRVQRCQPTFPSYTRPLSCRRLVSYPGVLANIEQCSNWCNFERRYSFLDQVYQHLNIIPSISSLTSLPSPKLAFKVYKPDTPFKKSQPGPPDFILFIARQEQ
jgi:hypothetical protein